MVLLLFGVGATAIVYTLATPARITIENDKRIFAAMAQARDALIGYAAAHSTQPGVLPCPDINNDGSGDSLAVDCGGAGVTAIGRFPWRQLGLDVRDAVGECLWYAVSGNFKNAAGPAGPTTLNSDTLGTLSVVDSTGTAVFSGTNRVVAIIFAPGLALSGQDRTPTPGPATVCGGNNTASNYLDSLTVGATTYNNATGSGTDTFVMSPAAGNSGEINDRLLPITSDALFNVVNIRVAKVAIAALESYRATNSYYPFANSYSSGAPYNCTSGLNRGRFPLRPGGCGQPAWGAALPNWFPNNEWNLVTHYAMSKACGQLGLPLGLDALAIAACDLLGNLSGIIGAINAVLPLFTDDPVTVSGVSNNVRALVIVTGRETPGQTHTCADVTNCMEDAANTDGNAAYAKPSRFPTSNDRMALTCATSSTCSTLP